MSKDPEVNMNFNAPVYGAAGKVEGDQIVNVPHENLDKALMEIIQILKTLQQNHPTATEEEAEDIIEAEFQEIKINQPNKWQNFQRQLLNPERWLKGGKAALSETAKHYLEDSVFAKASLAFLDEFSAE